MSAHLKLFGSRRKVFGRLCLGGKAGRLRRVRGREAVEEATTMRTKTTGWILGLGMLTTGLAFGQAAPSSSAKSSAGAKPKPAPANTAKPATGAAKPGAPIMSGRPVSGGAAVPVGTSNPGAMSGGAAKPATGTPISGGGPNPGDTMTGGGSKPPIRARTPQTTMRRLCNRRRRHSRRARRSSRARSNNRVRSSNRARPARTRSSQRARPVRACSSRAPRRARPETRRRCKRAAAPLPASKIRRNRSHSDSRAPGSFLPMPHRNSRAPAPRNSRPPVRRSKRSRRRVRKPRRNSPAVGAFPDMCNFATSSQGLRCLCSRHSKIRK